MAGFRFKFLFGRRTINVQICTVDSGVKAIVWRQGKNMSYILDLVGDVWEVSATCPELVKDAEAGMQLSLLECARAAIASEMARKSA